MAFQTYQDLIDTASTNPKLATDLVKTAQQKQIPVVSPENPGYKDDPRMAALKRGLKQQPQQSNQMQGSAPQDDVVANRKMVGY